MRTFLLGDLITRLAKQLGHKVEFIQNITDVGHMSEDFVEDNDEIAFFPTITGG